MSKRERDFKRNFNLIYPEIRNMRQVAFATREEISLSPAAEAYPVFWRGLPTRSLYNHCVMRIHDNIISGSPEESETSLLHARRIHVHHVPRFLPFFFFLLPPFRHSCSSTYAESAERDDVKDPISREKRKTFSDWILIFRSLSFFLSLGKNAEFRFYFEITNHFLDVYCCDSAVCFWIWKFYFEGIKCRKFWSTFDEFFFYSR